MPRDKSMNSSTDAMPGSSIDVTHDCIEEWDSTPHDTMPLDENKSLSLDEDEDALHAHRWDLIPEYHAPLAVPRDTLPSYTRPSARVTEAAAGTMAQHCFLDPYAHLMRDQETRRRSTASLPYLNLRGSMRAFEMALLLRVTSRFCLPIRSRYPHLHSLAY